MITNKNEIFVETEKPGVIVMVKLLEVISSYNGKRADEMLKDHSYACKRLFSKILSLRIGVANKKINDLKSFNKKLYIPESTAKLDLKKLYYSGTNDEVLLEFLVPLEKRLEVNDLNKKDVIKFYYKKHIFKSCEERKKIFFDFIMRGDNYSKYKQYFSKALQNFIDEEYNRNKASLFLEKYEKFVKKYQDNPFFK